MATKLAPVPDDNEPTDPWDLENLRYTEAEYKHGDVNSKKNTTLKVRKPKPQEWFRLHRDPIQG